MIAPSTALATTSTRNRRRFSPKLRRHFLYGRPIRRRCNTFQAVLELSPL
jgi:hypothetical protein